MADSFRTTARVPLDEKAFSPGPVRPAEHEPSVHELHRFIAEDFLVTALDEEQPVAPPQVVVALSGDVSPLFGRSESKLFLRELLIHPRKFLADERLQEPPVEPGGARNDELAVAPDGDPEGLPPLASPYREGQVLDSYGLHHETIRE